MAKSTKKENSFNLFNEIPEVRDKNSFKKNEVSNNNAIASNIEKKLTQRNEKVTVAGYVKKEIAEEFKRDCKEKNLQISEVLEQLIIMYLGKDN